MFSVAVHAGAGFHSKPNERSYKELCTAACCAAADILRCPTTETSAIDAATAAVRVLEDHILTNAGFGSCLSIDGTVECDAGVMCGKTLKFCSVGGVRCIKNPIDVARAMLIDHLGSTASETGRMKPITLCGEGASNWARDFAGIPLVPADSLISRPAHEKWRKYRKLVNQFEGRPCPTEVQPDPKPSLRKRPRFTDRLDTVGAVCIDSLGNVCAALSSGGIPLKMPRKETPTAESVNAGSDDTQSSPERFRKRRRFSSNIQSLCHHVYDRLKVIKKEDGTLLVDALRLPNKRYVRRQTSDSDDDDELLYRPRQLLGWPTPPPRILQTDEQMPQVFSQSSQPRPSTSYREMPAPAPVPATEPACSQQAQSDMTDVNFRLASLENKVDFLAEQMVALNNSVQQLQATMTDVVSALERGVTTADVGPSRLHLPLCTAEAYEDFVRRLTTEAELADKAMPSAKTPVLATATGRTVMADDRNAGTIFTHFKESPPMTSHAQNFPLRSTRTVDNQWKPFNVHWRTASPPTIYNDTEKRRHIGPEELPQDRPTWRRAVKTGTTIYETNRIAAVKTERTARKSQAPPMPDANSQPLPAFRRCQRTFRGRTSLVEHLRTLCSSSPTTLTSLSANTPSVTLEHQHHPPGLAPASITAASFTNINPSLTSHR
ncbi:taspase, threonine aspartase, 1 [Sparganum proliferum]